MPGSDVSERSLSGRLSLGPVSIDVAPGWRFYPMAEKLACRPVAGVGVLQFTIAPEPKLQNPSHEILMNLAKEASGYDLSGPGVDKAKELIDAGHAGGESFRTKRDFVRVWYHCRPEGLVLAWFACPVRRIAERSVSRLVGQCDKMVASIRLSPVMDA